MSSLFRLLVIGLAVYLLRKLFLSVWVSPSRPTAPASGPVREADTLVRDPVCGVCLPRERAVQASGQELFFCSQDCLEQFDPIQHQANSGAP